MKATPLLVIVVILAHVLMYTPGASLDLALWAGTLPSGARLALSFGDALVLLGLVLLYFEIYKATRPGTGAILDHVLSLALFVVCLLELLLIERAAHVSFVLITGMCLVDTVAGFTVSITNAQRDVGLHHA